MLEHLGKSQSYLKTTVVQEKGVGMVCCQRCAHNIVNIDTRLRKHLTGQTQGCKHLVLAIPKAEAGGLIEPRSSRPAWAT